MSSCSESPVFVGQKTDLQSKISLTSHWNNISEARGFIAVVNLLFLHAHSAVAPCWCQGLHFILSFLTKEGKQNEPCLQ